MEGAKTKEVEKMDIEPIQKILENKNVINWARKQEISEIQANKELEGLQEKLGIKAGLESIGMFDKSASKILITDAEFKGKAHCVIDLALVADVIKTLGANGRLLVRLEKDMPIVIEPEDAKDVVIIAPRVCEE